MMAAKPFALCGIEQRDNSIIEILVSTPRRVLLAEFNMHGTKARLLIVDDEPAIRTSMSLVLAEIGYRVRSAADGHSALLEIEQEVPDILLSDLNMPGMSGFELLSVVRRQFPAIQTIAMSGAFSGNEVPSGVAADAFYQKGSSMGALLQIIATIPQVERRLPQPSSAVAPFWIRTFPTSALESRRKEKDQCTTSPS
jgi:CheY-like chemotaxis protein